MTSSKAGNHQRSTAARKMGARIRSDPQKNVADLRSAPCLRRSTAEILTPRTLRFCASSDPACFRPLSHRTAIAPLVRRPESQCCRAGSACGGASTAAEFASRRYPRLPVHILKIDRCSSRPRRHALSPARDAPMGALISALARAGSAPMPASARHSSLKKIRSRTRANRQSAVRANLKRSPVNGR